MDQDPRLQPCYGQTSPDSGKEFCTYPAGTVAMAKGAQPGTNGSQFFLVYEDSILDAAYTVARPDERCRAQGRAVGRREGRRSPAPRQPKQPVTITSVK